MVAYYGTRLEAAMRARGVSAQQMAEQIGVSYQAVNKVLKGQSTAFNASNNAYAARFLKVSGDWLATGEGPMIDKTPTYASQEDNALPLAAWQSAREEAREVARFALSKYDAPLPAWATEAMRKDLDSMIYRAQCWLRSDEQPKAKAPAAEWENKKTGT